MAEHQPVLVAQWGQLGEKKLDVTKIFEKLFGASAVQSSTGPQMHAVKEDDPEPRSFAGALRDAMLRNKSGLQIVYIAAHGGCQGIAAGPDSKQLSYSELGEVFNATWSKYETGGVALILGTCNSLSGRSKLLCALPASVEMVIGFASKTSQKTAVELAARAINSARQALSQDPSRPLSDYLADSLQADLLDDVDVVIHRRKNITGSWCQVYPDQQSV